MNILHGIFNVEKTVENCAFCGNCGKNIVLCFVLKTI